MRANRKASICTGPGLIPPSLPSWSAPVIDRASPAMSISVKVLAAASRPEEGNPSRGSGGVGRNGELGFIPGRPGRRRSNSSAL
eukprot:7481567-Pyramimonas_sp.AAC.1